VAALDDAVNPRVVTGEEVNRLLNLGAGLAIGPEVGGLLGEEVGTETLVGVEEDAVDVVVGLGAHILDEELNLVDEITTLDGLGRAGLLGRLGVSLDAVLHVSGLDLGHIEAGTESGNRVIRLVEELLESRERERLVLLVDFGEDDGGETVSGLEASLLVGLIIRDLGGHAGGELAGADESHDVRIVLKNEDLLVDGGLIVSARSNLDDASLLEVGELDLESKRVEGGTGGIVKLQLVGVLIELEDLEHLGDDIEVRVGGLDLLERSNIGLLHNGVLHEEGVGPLLEGLHDGEILRLLGGLLARVGIRGISDNLAERRDLLGGVENPGTVPVHVDVELSLLVPDSELGTMDTDDVTDSVDDGEILESVGIEHNGGVVLGRDLGVESGINDLKRAHEEFFSLVGEGSIDNDTIEVARVGGSEGSLAEFDVLVLGLGLLGGDRASSRSAGRGSRSSSGIHVVFVVPERFKIN